MVALVGAGGTGKSILANVFASEWALKGDKTRFGISIESSTEDEVRKGYLDLCKLINVRLPETSSTADLAGAAWKSLRFREGEWIVLFDNVPEFVGTTEGPEAFEPLFFPIRPGETSSNGRILFTTRHESYNGETYLGYITKVEVKTLEKREAAEFLLLNVGTNCVWKRAAERLVSKAYFDGLPLAIKTARNELIAESMDVKVYYEQVKTGSRNEVGRVVKENIQGSLDYARRKEHSVAHALNLAAFESPDQIPLSRLGNDKPAVQFLCKLNLLRLVNNNGNEYYAMHRLHQLAAKVEAPASYENSKRRSSVSTVIFVMSFLVTTVTMVFLYQNFVGSTSKLTPIYTHAVLRSFLMAVGNDEL